LDDDFRYLSLHECADAIQSIGHACHGLPCPLQKAQEIAVRAG